MKSNKIRFNILIFLFTLLVVSGSIILPNRMLTTAGNEHLSLVVEAPEEYYLASATAIAVDASSKLSGTEKINLTTGAWESIITECDISDGFLTETEAVELAKSQLEIFKDNLVYPCSLKSGYKNWYSYQTKLYSCTDATFNTYVAYLWEITFTKYDGSLVHTILMTENGTIINAQVNQPDYKAKSILNSYKDSTIGNIWGNNSARISNEKNCNDYYKLNHSYPSIQIISDSVEQAYYISVSEESEAASSYIIYQYKTDSHYGIGIMPE